MDDVPDSIVELARQRFLLVDVRSLSHGASALILSLPSEREDAGGIIVYGRIAYVWARPDWGDASAWIVTHHVAQSTADREFRSLSEALEWTDRYLRREPGLLEDSRGHE